MLKPGLVVNCRVGNKQMNGYAVELLENSASSGFLLTNRDLGAEEIVKAVIIGMHTEQSYIVLREYTQVDELCDSILAKAACEVGVTLEQVETARTNVQTARTNVKYLGEKVDKHILKIDVSELGPDFDTNLVEILSGWAIIAADKLDEIEERRAAPNAVALEQLLVEFGCIRDEYVLLIQRFAGSAGLAATGQIRCKWARGRLERFNDAQCRSMPRSNSLPFGLLSLDPFPWIPSLGSLPLDPFPWICPWIPT